VWGRTCQRVALMTPQVIRTSVSVASHAQNGPDNLETTHQSYFSFFSCPLSFSPFLCTPPGPWEQEFCGNLSSSPRPLSCPRSPQSLDSGALLPVPSHPPLAVRRVSQRARASSDTASGRAAAHACLVFLVREPEVQPLVPFVGGGSDVVQPLLRCHGAPLRVPLLVPEHIIRLHQPVQHNIHAEDAQQLAVATSVQRRVVWRTS